MSGFTADRQRPGQKKDRQQKEQATQQTPHRRKAGKDAIGNCIKQGADETTSRQVLATSLPCVKPWPPTVGAPRSRPQRRPARVFSIFPPCVGRALALGCQGIDAPNPVRTHNHDHQKFLLPEDPVSHAPLPPPSFAPDFSKGLVPAIAQDAATGEVLMLAYMDENAWNATLRTGEAHYWSRSRQELWHKGGTSGNVQKVQAIRLDCDADTILLLIEQIGGAACHTGRRSCFFREWKNGEEHVCSPQIFDPAAVYGK